MKNTKHVMIYNVSNKLIQARGSDRLVGFKYPESSNGYAHFIVRENEVTPMNSNENMRLIKMDKSKEYYFVYEKKGIETAEKLNPVLIKKLFDKSRIPRSVNKNTSKVADRGTPDIVKDNNPDLSIDDFSLYF